MSEQTQVSVHVGSALTASVAKRMPQHAERCEIVVISRDELASVMSLCFLDGLDAGLDALTHMRDGSITSSNG
jgi:hypothetical protein